MKILWGVTEIAFEMDTLQVEMLKIMERQYEIWIFTGPRSKFNRQQLGAATENLPKAHTLFSLVVPLNTQTF